jgi:hypothetical protein
MFSAYSNLQTQRRTRQLTCIILLVTIGFVTVVILYEKPKDEIDMNQQPIIPNVIHCFPDICQNSKRDIMQEGDKIQNSFEKIYRDRLWGNSGEGSGHGSEPAHTITTRLIMEMVIYKYHISSLLDAPCGAIKWTRVLLAKIFSTIPCFKYYGVDVVRPVIQNLTEEFKLFENLEFSTLDISNLNITLPQADLILSRDALQHLPYENIVNVIENYAKSHSKYLIVGSYPTGKNRNINIGMTFYPS